MTLVGPVLVGDLEDPGGTLVGATPDPADLPLLELLEIGFQSSGAICAVPWPRPAGGRGSARYLGGDHPRTPRTTSLYLSWSTIITSRPAISESAGLLDGVFRRLAVHFHVKFGSFITREA